MEEVMPSMDETRCNVVGYVAPKDVGLLAEVPYSEDTLLEGFENVDVVQGVDAIQQVHKVVLVDAVVAYEMAYDAADGSSMVGSPSVAPTSMFYEAVFACLVREVYVFKTSVDAAMVGNISLYNLLIHGQLSYLALQAFSIGSVPMVLQKVIIEVLDSLLPVDDAYAILVLALVLDVAKVEATESDVAVPYG